MSDLNTLTVIQNPQDEERCFEQYKLIIDSVNQLNMSRELSNPFWATVNGVTLTGISFVNDLSEMTRLSKPLLTSFLLSAGYLFCLSWIGYLNTLRKSLETRYEILLEIEKYFPVKFFQKVYGKIHKKEGTLSLSFKELLVPCIFIIAYTFFLASLVF